MPTRDAVLAEATAVPQPGREFSSSALFASLALAGSFAALGLNSISISRIEGASGAGLIALSTQFIFLATFVAGAGLRTSVTYRVGAGLWSPRSAVAGVLTAALWLGLVGAALGLGTYVLLRNGAMREFSPGMAIALMSAFRLPWHGGSSPRFPWHANSLSRMRCSPSPHRWASWCSVHRLPRSPGRLVR